MSGDDVLGVIFAVVAIGAFIRWIFSDENDDYPRGPFDGFN